MGEYIKHPTTGTKIKIGKADGDRITYFYTREQLQQFKDQGYRGFCNNEWDNTLETALHVPENFICLFPLPENDHFDSKVDTITLQDNQLPHEPSCKYVPGGKMQGVPVQIAVRSDNIPYTLFECVSCRIPFSITDEEMILKEHPHWRNIIVPRITYSPITTEEIKRKCEENDCVKSFGSYYARQGDPMVDACSDFNVHHCKTIQELEKAFMTYDVLRQCFVYENLVFVNSTLGGGWEAWTLKKFGDELIAFESISMQLIIKEGTHDGLTFEQYIEQLLALTKYQVEHYLEM